MKKEKNKIFAINSIPKLVTINMIIFALICIALYLIIPYVLNYPPNSIDNDFQVDVVGIKYTDQFIILGGILSLFILGALTFLYNMLSIKKIKNKHTNKIDINQVEKIRKRSFNFPYLTLLFTLLVPPIVVCFCLFLFNTTPELNLRITIIIFCMSAIFSIFSYIVNKSFFVNTLVNTAKISNKTTGFRLNLYIKMLLQMLPIFLYSFIIILLLSLSLLTTEKGDLLYNLYHQELSNYFSDKEKVYNLNDLPNILKENMTLQNEQDNFFIISCETGDVYYSEEELNIFFKKYLDEFYEKTNGHVYDNYGQNIEGSALKVHTNEGDYYVGIRFYVFSSSFITPFIIATIILIFFNILFVLYISRDFSNDIKTISKQLNNIAASSNISNEHNLPITSNDELGDLTVAFNKVQDKTKQYNDTIKANQETLMESERLASLGQLIGGIAHNLKTPIMSISGAAEGLTDLIKEYDTSIDDPEVTHKDHHDIAKDMSEWVDKIKTYTAYMSDVITAVKGQAVNLSSDNSIYFKIDELLKDINILMKHELKIALVTLNVHNYVASDVQINGDVNALVQVINNMISNSIQAYNGKPNQSIDLTLKTEDTNLLIEIQDYGVGMPQEVQDRLFKEMITTKGKNGTGLGLFMSCSTIKAHFNGDIKFESEHNKGTKFTIILPLPKNK